MKNYKCLFNHELLILVTTESPYQTYRENVKEEQVRGYIRELQDTDVDVILCCPTAWKSPLYPSRVDPKWTDEAPGQVEPLPEGDWKYGDKVYWRARRMMLSGIDPLKISIETARECGKDIFLSYRMNDNHLNIYPDSPIHSRFWRDNPGLRIRPELSGKTGNNDALNLNYLEEEVRHYVKAILFELIDNYDFDGVELDFMRTPPHLPVERVEEGIPILTAFMQEIREKLDQAGKKRGRKLPLCVRVPRNLDLCRKTGFDLVEWNRRGLIDMVNASTHFVTCPNWEIEEFKKALPGCRIYGEMHFIYELGDPLPGGFRSNILRKTPNELYKAAALTLLERGADGVSLFNFSYVREHSFAEPRRTQYPGKEPHYDVLKGIVDPATLQGVSKLYHWNGYYAPLPVSLASQESSEFDVYIADADAFLPTFHAVVLRLEGNRDMGKLPFDVHLNGTPATPEPLWTGELVTPFSREALPTPEMLLHYSVPPSQLKHGWNKIRLTNASELEYGWGQTTIKNIQLALYRKPEDLPRRGTPRASLKPEARLQP